MPLGSDATVDFETARVRSADGFELTAHAAGDPSAPAVVLVNAYLMPVDFMQPLAASLLPRYRVLTWDTRLPPEDRPEPGELALGLSAQSADLLAVMRHHHVESVVGIVGWCTGASVALRFAAEHPDRVRSLVLLNGAFVLPESFPRTRYDRTQLEILQRVARKPYLSRAFCKMMESMRKRPSEDGVAESELLARAGTRNPEILEMVVQPLSDPSRVYRYALLLDAFRTEPEHACDAPCPDALVVTARRDTIAHPERSFEIARRLGDATLYVDETGDHYIHYTSQPTRDRVRAFLDAHAG